MPDTHHLESALHDLTLAARRLSAEPAFALVAVVSLAVGIGANAALFSLADAALWRPLPVRDPQRLVELVAVHPRHRQTNLPSEVLGHLQSETEDVIRLFASQGRSVQMRVELGVSEPVPGLFVSGNYFAVLGASAALGRPLGVEDDRPGAPRVCVLSHALWQRRFGGRRDIVGQTVWIDGTPTTVVGVTSREFVGVDWSRPPAVVLPLAADRSTANLWVAGRLGKGVTLDEAQSRLEPRYGRAIEAMQSELEEWPEDERVSYLSQRLQLVPAGNGTVDLRWQADEPLRVLSLAVLVVLLIASMNVAVLTLSRGDRRSREIATRLALGAGRSRVVQQLLVESTLLALLGGAAGVGVAVGLHRLLLRLSPLDPAAAVEFQLDGHMLAFLIVASALSGLSTGLVPAIRLTRVDPSQVLARGTGVLGQSRPKVVRRMLVTQVAGTLALLSAAGLFAKSLANLVVVPTGFSPDNLLVVSMNVIARSESRPQNTMRQRRLVEHARTLPGVEAAALAARSVFSPREPWIMSIWVAGVAEKQPVRYNAVGPGFFDAVRLPLRAGREFRATDAPGEPRVAVVNEAFAEAFFAGGDTIGRRLGWNAGVRREVEIVGVVADAKVRTLREPPSPTLYLPMDQEENDGRLVLHLRVQPSFVRSPSILSGLARADPELEVAGAAWAEDALADSLREERLFATLSSLFALIALSLTAIGLYGAMAYAATRRVREIGIRMALGATGGRVLGMMLGENARAVMTGIAIGLPVTATGVRALRGLLFGLGSWDPGTFLMAGGLLAAVGVLAGLAPARAAASLPPITALRHD